jgi:CrcB protein
VSSPDPHPELPPDPDADDSSHLPDPGDRLPARAPRPVHLRASSIGLVLLGGTLGTAAREAITLAVPELGGVPIALVAINLVGAFLLGLLLESLARGGPDVGARRSLRLLLGTGVMGGFTSYSALALGTDQLLADGAAGRGIAFALVSVVLGVACAAAGILVASSRGSHAAPAPAQGAGR